MEKYLLFRKLMDMLSDDCDVVDAKMNNLYGDIEIVCKSESEKITVIAKIEEAKDGK